MPNNLQTNPFTTIKANDLRDDEIISQWVDFEKNGFYDLFSPTNLMPMYIQGGKGCGKTHLMRYFSYQAQTIRNQENPLAGIKSDGYFCIYFQASSLAGSRFDLISDMQAEKESLIIYSIDLFIAGLFLESLIKLQSFGSIFSDEASFCNEVMSIFLETAYDGDLLDLISLRDYILSLSRDIDLQVSNPWSSSIEKIRIRANRGELVFKIPELLAKYSPVFSESIFLYLIDELENIDVDSQRYINSLIREKKQPTSFRIGVRKHGIKSYKILGVDEENKEGNEFSTIDLDSLFSDEKKYKEFATELIINRLSAKGLAPSQLPSYTLEESLFDERIAYLNNYFEAPAINEIIAGYEKSKPGRLIESLARHLRGKSKEKEKEVERIITTLRAPHDLIAEQAGIHIFCQEWSKEKLSLSELFKVSENIKDELFAHSKNEKSSISQKISYYKNNYIASIIRGNRHNTLVVYTGLENLIELTKGFPRHLLTILRKLYHLEIFAGRPPFQDDNKISIKSQEIAIKETSDWFHDDSVSEGKLGRSVAIALSRITELLRIEFYADKPSECSCSSFALDPADLPEESADVLSWAKLLKIVIPANENRIDKNSDKVLQIFHINSLLAPRYGLPIARRGSLLLNSTNAKTIFDVGSDVNFKKYLNEFSSSRNAPYLIPGAPDDRGQQRAFELS